MGPAGFASPRRNLWSEYYRSPGLYRRHYASGRPLKANGPDRNGFWIGVRIRTALGGARNPAPRFERPGLSRCRFVHAKFSPRTDHPAGELEAKLRTCRITSTPGPVFAYVGTSQDRVVGGGFFPG